VTRCACLLSAAALCRSYAPAVTVPHPLHTTCVQYVEQFSKVPWQEFPGGWWCGSCAVRVS
jgi:hypothetical protein